MPTRKDVLLALLMAAALVFCMLYRGVVDWALYQVHTTVERLLGETPEAKLASYLDAVKSGERDTALACWPAREHLGADYETRRQQVTEQLLALGPSLRHQVLEVEWWRTCCEPGRVADPDIAGMARMLVEVTDEQGRTHPYVFDIGTTTQYWGDAGDDPVRRWVLWDVYLSDEPPLVFRWPLGPTSELAVTTEPVALADGGHPAGQME